ncbi:MAG TPA: hypothetical protein PKI03_17340, partial [Pseudomonadota bacterium]|nr:hypothetical protein [Pseudomonadota bacterium]
QKLRDIRKANQVFRAEESAPPDAAPAMGGRSHDGVRPVRPATAGAIPALRPGGPASKPAEAMVRLDQDDFPEKPTVVVDPGAVDSPAMAAAAAAAALGRSNPGMHAMGPPPPMPMPQASSYAAAAASQMGVQPVVGQSGSVSPYAGSASNVTLPSAGLSTERSQTAPGRRRTLLIVVAVIVIAVLAPVIALIVRSTSNRGSDEHGDPSGNSDTPGKKPPTPPNPPTPKDPEVKATPDPTPDNTPDKGTKKGTGGKKKPPVKGKSDGGKKPEAPKKGDAGKKDTTF